FFELTTNNEQGEYYLTDTVAILLNKGLRADAYLSQNPEVVLGANDRKGLLELNNTARMNEIYKHLENGVEFNCTDGITIERGVIIGSGTLILPGTIIKGKTIISDNCVIGPNCIIDDCIIGYNTKLNYVQAFESTIGDNVKIGPFVHVRPNSTIKSGVKIGDFVEVKNSVVGEDTAIAHLTYVGDSDVGRHVNFGCGCVTVNYDGCKKSRTTIGDNAFIGCNTNLIAPVSVGNGAYTAAGTTVTKDVPDNALALDRGEFRIKEGYALKKLKGRNT
ncbi:MAG TPA: DapH/DapD/GlmU-related protein, partial [Oscillospiraceae bacterium]|nr:DapH/DapD/GlmU-related protein [Oscillospiraceae bacterium]